MRCTYPLQRENEPDVSEMGTAGEARQCGSLTSCNARTSRTSAEWLRRVWGGDGFTYLLQRENEPNVSKMATAGARRCDTFHLPSAMRQSPTSAKWPRRVRRGDAVHLQATARERAGHQQIGNSGARRGDAVHLPPATRERSDVSGIGTTGGRGDVVHLPPTTRERRKSAKWPRRGEEW